MKKDNLSKKLLSLIIDEDLDVDLNKVAEEIGEKAIHTSGVFGVALVVANATGSSMALLTKSKLMKNKDLLERLENHITKFKQDHPEDFAVENDKDESDTSDDEELDPKMKIMLAMVAKNKFDKDGDPNGEFMVKAFLEMKKMTEKGMSNSEATVRAVNKVLGSPLSKREEKELIKMVEKHNDED